MGKSGPAGAPGAGGVLTIQPPPSAQPSHGSPTILSVGLSPSPTVGRQSVLRVRASEPGGAVAGLNVNFGERGGRFGESACALPFGNGPAGLRDVEEFAVPYTFRLSGPHVIRVVVTVEACDGSPAKATEQVLVRKVKPRSRNGRRGEAGVAAIRAAPADCTNTDLVPDESNVAVVADATVCLINAERAAVGLAALTREATLESAAGAHGKAMIVGRFFSHQGPGEPPLAARIVGAGYKGSGAAENVGWGVDTSASASGIVAAWMRSTSHRDNILNPNHREIGIALDARAPTGNPVPGATYTTEFGTGPPTPATAPAGTPPSGATATAAPAAGRAPAMNGAPVKAGDLSITPRAFRPTSPTAPAAKGFGARLEYRLSVAATVVVVVRQNVAGRRVGRSCVRARAANRSRKRCARKVLIGIMRRQSVAGPNQLKLFGQIRGRPLAPGTYVVTIAKDSRGREPLTAPQTFRILPRPAR